MDKILEQVQRLREDTEALVAAPSELTGEAQCHSEARSCLNCGGLRWLESLKEKCGKWKCKPLVVLSLFDGIGGVWVALRNLGIPFIGYSCELCDDAIEVTKKNFPTIRHLGDIKKIQRADIKEKVDFVVGGFPCQDLTSMGKKLGLHASRSRLFFDMMRVIKTFNPTWFLAENVASMSWIDREEITKHLGIIPIEIDARFFTPCRRKRLYWSNIPYPKVCPRVDSSAETSFQSVLRDGAALCTKNSCVLTANAVGGNVQMELIYDLKTRSARYINVGEIELMMGYPSDYTKVRNDRQSVQKSLANQTAIRWRLLGNTFSVPVITYLLSSLLESDTTERTTKYCLPSSVREQDCSVMDPGEVWAVYNSHHQPNWYAKVLSRSGGRFDRRRYAQANESTTLPLEIEVKFLHLTKAYEKGEEDLWNTVRGTGLYSLSDNVNLQGSWTPFSHRVTSLFKCDKDKFFVYPGEGEVWSVYDEGTDSRYLVYVVQSSIHKQSAVTGMASKERFSARCRLLQKLIELDLYKILDKELVYTDLSVFSCRAPHHFLNDACTLKVELSVKHRGTGAHRVPTSNKKRRLNESSEDDCLSDLEA